MFKIKFILLMLLALNINSFAYYKYDDPKLGNISLSGALWKTKINGIIDNNKPSNTDIKNDLGFGDEKNINSLSMDFKNEINWLPNININFFNLSQSSSSTLNNSKYFSGEQNIFTDVNGSVSSNIEYSSIDAILYGYLYQGPFEFDLGLKLKKIDYTQTIKENKVNGNVITIKGPNSLIVLPHIALKVNISEINTVLKFQTSMLTTGDTEAKDYEYSINYRVMRNMYISYGHRFNSWKSVNANNIHEKYNIELEGKYLAVKILF